MKTILLAAGQSKRVKPIRDKNFVRICGKPLIFWQIMSLRKGGFSDLVIVSNKDNLEQIQKLHFEGMNIQVVEQVDLEPGMLGAMQAAKPLVIDQDRIMVVSSNDVVESELWQKVAAGLKTDHQLDGFLVGYRVKTYFPGGYLSMNEQGFIQSIVEKPGEGNEPSDLVNLVIHVHNDVRGLYAALESVSWGQMIPATPNPLKGEKTSNHLADDLYEKSLQSLFDQDKKYRVIPYDGFW